MNKTWLYHATRQPNRSIENIERSWRLLSYLCENESGVLYKDIRRDLGLSYHQTVSAVGLLCAMGMAKVTVTAEWNGLNYIYPHKVSLSNPRSL